MRSILGLWLLLGAFWPAQSESLDSLLLVLDQEIQERSAYDSQRELRINSIKGLLEDPNLGPEDQYPIYSQLIREYATYTFDSALQYINRNIALAERIGNEEFLSEARLYQAKMLAYSGTYKEALDILELVDKQSLKEGALRLYYTVYHKVYEDLYFYSRINSNSQSYHQLMDTYMDSLTNQLNPEYDLYWDLIEKEYRDSRQMDKCLEINKKRMAQAKMATPQYALIAFQRSLIHEINGDVEQQKVYLALSAISDLRASIKDNASLTQLALLLYEEKEIDRAYRYIKVSFEDAEFFNSRLRFIEISNIFPLITAAYQKRIDKQNEQLRTSLALISLLSLGLAVMVFVTIRQVKKVRKGRNDLREANMNLKELNDEMKLANEKLNDLNMQLVESDSIKEQYIASFLNICSDFIDKLDNYRRMVKKMITNRKYEELYQTTNSHDLIDRELRLFYETFDSTFLNIYPDFVKQVNELLLDGEKIELKQGELLNTELRIFALIRLGIRDSSQISKLLRYSVNTIYNYRVKVKNKAAGPRDEFEDQIMQINAIAVSQDSQS